MVDEYGIDLHSRDKDEWMMEQETGLRGAGEIWGGNFTQQITHGYYIRYTSNQTQS